MTAKPQFSDNPQSATEVFPLEVPSARYRLAAGVEYHGAGYSGYQIQSATDDTVQGVLQKALSTVANEPIKIHCAGRTDAGVHATGQVVHFDTASARKPYGWVLGTNTHLPRTISVQWVKAVPLTFHARFSARSRRYRYVIYNHWVPSAVMPGSATWERRPLDVARMQTAAQTFLGTHDFSTFRAAECQAHSPVRTVHWFNVIRCGRLVVLDIQADAFLHHMVRNLAGVLMAIGYGAAPIEWAAEVLAKRDRRSGGITARPDGLYLVDVEYDPAFGLPASPPGPHFLPAGACS